jgi:cell division cycle protein 37
MQRNFRIAQLQADVDCNTVLLGRLIEIEKNVREKGPDYYSQLVDRLRSAPSDERPEQSGPNDPTYDDMILKLLSQVWEKCKEGGAEKGDTDLGEKLAGHVGEHVVGLREEIEKKTKELEAETEEKGKKITSEDIHEGWDSKVRMSFDASVDSSYRIEL